MSTNAPRTLDRFIRSMTQALADAGSESPALDAELIAAGAMGIERHALLKERILAPDRELPPAVIDCAMAHCARREKREPMAYILGDKEFFGRPFAVTPATLIPRPDTELLVEKALEYARDSGMHGGIHNGRFADFGTGSGAIAITVALELPGWEGLAIDISEQALATAAANAARLGAATLCFAHADFSRPLTDLLPDASYDMILSNPPYIPEHEYAALDDDVRLFEPKSALVPGPDGTELARCVAQEAARVLAPGGLLLMEMGWNQGEAYSALLPSQIWRDVTVHSDLAGHDRVLEARRAG
ncbi:peptide chain release factor N(5)-glutamine methyltransferase [Desulfovibrio sp. OttesenSCG-928-I05]|nr:peptide chain release factor N(5)-glutamine methyltransferase [Desulfovibrio sp. OttesenSCG-928-I05]